MMTEGPWKSAEHEGEEQRGVYGPGNVLVADCYAATYESCGVPEDYKANAIAIAGLPDLIKAAKEFVEDIDALGLEAVREDWPDLEKTYHHTRDTLKKMGQLDGG
ncbi:MAG: hypothetical protein R3B95_11660 [Nitrospirales bacterium]|nr:hypothetical protein [Nitrospirales bacterium]